MKKKEEITMKINNKEEFNRQNVFGLGQEIMAGEALAWCKGGQLVLPYAVEVPGEETSNE